MIIIGQRNQLKIDRITPPGAFLTDGEEDVLLPKKYVSAEAQVGDIVDVFIYLDSEDRIIATTESPKAMVGQFAVLEVKNTTSFGAFLDWGLEKDLLLPFAEQPYKVKPTQKVPVFVYLDQFTNRIAASAKLKRYFKRRPDRLREGSKVDAIIYGKNQVGFLCIVNKMFSGILYRSELFERVQIGDELTAYVKKVREDGLVDLNARQGGYQGAIDNSIPKILKKLEKTGYMPYNANSDADDIRAIFDMSKRDFKKAIGSLYKERKITIEDDGIRLAGVTKKMQVRK